MTGTPGEERALVRLACSEAHNGRFDALYVLRDWYLDSGDLYRAMAWQWIADRKRRPQVSRDTSVTEYQWLHRWTWVDDTRDVDDGSRLPISVIVLLESPGPFGSSTTELTSTSIGPFTGLADCLARAFEDFGVRELERR